MQLYGKVVLAVDDDAALRCLDDLHQRAIANGVEALELLGPAGIGDHDRPPSAEGRTGCRRKPSIPDGTSSTTSPSAVTRVWSPSHNAPSPAATASLAIASVLTAEAEKLVGDPRRLTANDPAGSDISQAAATSAMAATRR